MPAEYYQAGTHLDHTPSSALTAGTPVDLGSGLIGIPSNDIAADQKGSVAIGGVYKLPKMAATAMAVGDLVEYDASEDEVVPDADADGDYDIGKVAYAAASADGYVYVLLNGQAI